MKERLNNSNHLQEEFKMGGIEEKVNSNVRNSSFELLRLLCIFGIVFMHTFGEFYRSSTGLNLVMGVWINSLFNTGVTIFVLISGYFGIRFSVKRLIKLELEVLFYSIASFVITTILKDSLSCKNLIKAFFPILTGRYWFITAYMLLFIFSPFINQIPEKLEKKSFQKLLAILFVLFSVIPTFLYFDIMKDGGKGVINMFLVYLIGYYIRLYSNSCYSKIKLFLAGFGVVLTGFVLNYVLSLMKHGGIVAPFARDCSMIIIISSILIFLLFREIHFTSSIINMLAKHVLSIYLFEGAVRSVFGHFFSLAVYSNSLYLGGVITVYVLLVISVCMGVNIFRNRTIGRLDGWICKVVVAITCKCVIKWRSRDLHFLLK